MLPRFDVPVPHPNMRPTLSKPRSRKSSIPDHAGHGPSSHVPTAFFMKSEGDLEQSAAASEAKESFTEQKESTFGVQSLEDTLEAAFGPEGSAADSPKDQAASPTSNRKSSPTSSPQSPQKASSRHSESPTASPVKKLKRKISNQTASTPLTPIIADAPSPAPPSAIPSTPKSVSLQSLKLSDEDSCPDDAASEAVMSSGDEDDEETQQGASGSFPQLVMPSIQMPTRRPFTTRGKAMGKLKVLVAGEAGIGKSALIRSIVQHCEDIVHVDPLSPSQSFDNSPPPKPKSRKRKVENAGTTRITEIHASTKPYPHWWAEFEENRASRRRKSSTSDAVLERNFCFVDTPGYREGASAPEDTGLVVEYVESLLYQTACMTSLEDSDLLGVVSGNGGVLVDVVFYLLPPSHDISKDVEFMQRLSALTNVIPIIAKSDTLSAADITAIKTSILARLQSTSVKPFLFGKALDDALLAVQGLSTVQPSSPEPTPSNPLDATEANQYPFTNPTYPYAISSGSGPDNDNMDASLLMSPDYVQPLLPSELMTLVNQTFDPDSISWLRHSSAKKFLAWSRRAALSTDGLALPFSRRSSLHRGGARAGVGLNAAAMNTSTSSSLFSPTSPSGVLLPHPTSPFYLSNSQSPYPTSSPSLSTSHHTSPPDPPNDFSLTRYTQNTLSHPPDVHLAKWATDLQRSLHNERSRFAHLHHSERAKWLLERVGEEVVQGTIVASPGGTPRAEWAVAKRGDAHASGTESEKRASVRRKNGLAAVPTLDARDPLGLCDFSDELRRRGYVLATLLGGVSVVGAVVVAVVRALDVEMGSGTGAGAGGLFAVGGGGGGGGDGGGSGGVAGLWGWLVGGGGSSRW